MFRAMPSDPMTYPRLSAFIRGPFAFRPQGRGR
jgi:hypothetical protein